mmetsp:Transcript_14947/g.18819  ORF Transcript_14947/g.18819 Transcript_14947/m.18819 type:complete len:203 (+) Transcript_14947:159-767(+)
MSLGGIHNMKGSKMVDPVKAAKKKEKKKRELSQNLALMTPFLMFSGAGRFMLNAENKRKIIKMAQIQEFVLHTVAIGGLISYNMEQDIVKNEDLELFMTIAFIGSASFSLIELVYYYCMKVKGVNVEIDRKTQKPHANQKFVRGYGFCSVVMAALAIGVGFSAFDEQGCLDRWFVHDENICTSCTLYFGEECLDCTSSAKCD